MVTVHVKKDHNSPPVAVVSHAEVTVYLPTRDVVVDGTKSHDDEIIEKFKWTRAGLSPAAGVVMNGSDTKPMLKLTNLVKGRYIFDLTVTDNKGGMSHFNFLNFRFFCPSLFHDAAIFCASP